MTILFVKVLYSQPTETMAGRYEDHGFWRDHPYTMFNKRNGNWNLQEELTKIKNLIYAGQADPSKPSIFKNIYARLYSEIYQAAQTPEPPKSGYADQKLTSPHAAWTKNNAIIYLIGIKCSSIGNRIVFEPMTDPSLKQYFRDQATTGMRNMNTNVVSCIGGPDCGLLLNRGQELIEYAQAYDVLKCTDAYPTDDRNAGPTSGRNRLREFTRNYHTNVFSVINSTAGWKKNHGIIACSALGTAALVLNDAGVETSYTKLVASAIFPIYGLLNGFWQPIPHPTYSPINTII